MKVVVIGGTGLIGSKLVTKLAEHGHDAVPASPNTGVNTLTGDGLAEALDGADVVVDVSNSPSFEADAVLSFFETSTKNLLEAEEQAGVGHHVALSVVGTDRLTRERILPGQDRPGKADQRIPDPLFHRSRHTILRVHQEHRRRGDGRDDRPAGSRSDSAHGRRRRGRRGRQDSSGATGERDHRSGRPRGIPPRRTHPGRPQSTERSARSHLRPGSTLLRSSAVRENPRAG